MKKLLIALIANLAACSTISACPWCRAAVNRSVYDGAFAGQLLVLLLPVVLLGALGILLYNCDKIAGKLKGGTRTWLR